MLKKIEGNNKAAQVEAFVKEAEAMIEKFGWQEQTVHPYSYPVKITKIIGDLKDYNICTRGSQEYLVALANGLADILNAWAERESTPKVKVRLLDSGNIIELHEADLDIFDGLVERV